MVVGVVGLKFIWRKFGERFPCRNCKKFILFLASAATKILLSMTPRNCKKKCRIRHVDKSIMISCAKEMSNGVIFWSFLGNERFSCRMTLAKGNFWRICRNIILSNDLVEKNSAPCDMAPRNRTTNLNDVPRGKEDGDTG